MKYYKTLQKSINIMGEPIIDYISKLVDCNDKILITSPHPDDDVTEGRNNAIVPNPNNISVAYMTNGDGGLLSNESGGTRLKEALSSLTVLGLGKKNIIDVSMPFYTNKFRTVTQDDIVCFETLLENTQPDHLFICADKDPNGTHRKCYDVFVNVKKIVT